MSAEYSDKQNSSSSKYTCNEYREEMILLALRQKLQNPNLTNIEKENLNKEISDFEEKFGF